MAAKKQFTPEQAHEPAQTAEPVQAAESVVVNTTTDAGPGENEAVGDGTGEALPAVSQDESQVPAAEIVQTVQVVSARVLCAVTIGAKRYQPNDVIVDLPADVLAQHAGSLDANAQAVAEALSQGGATVSFEV